MLTLFNLSREEILALWVRIFGDSAAVMLVYCGIMALVWFFYEGVRRGFVKPKNEAWERDKVSRILKIIIYIGILLGLISIITAIVTIVLEIPPSYAYRDNPGPHSRGNTFDWLTSISLLVMGLAMFIKPLEDVPIATIIGLGAGAAVSLLLGLLLPAELMQNTVMKWILIGIFVIVTSAVGAMLKVWVDGIEFVAKVLSWPPVAILLAAYCLVQGFSVWIMGYSLILFGG
jgi:pimeloyl-ACP methyl ester carboxylesterase